MCEREVGRDQSRDLFFVFTGTREVTGKGREEEEGERREGRVVIGGDRESKLVSPPTTPSQVSVMSDGRPQPPKEIKK